MLAYFSSAIKGDHDGHYIAVVNRHCQIGRGAAGLSIDQQEKRYKFSGTLVSDLPVKNIIFVRVLKLLPAR